MNRKMILWAALAALSAAPLSAQTLLDMTPSSFSTFMVNGAQFVVSVDDQTVSGTGVYNTFLGHTQQDDIVTAFNSSSGSLMQAQDSKTFDLTSNQLVTIANTKDPLNTYYAFGADINEPASPTTPSPKYLSLDRLQVWVKLGPTSIDPANSEAALTGSGATKIWDLDEGDNRSILFDYTLASSGSGRSDLLFVIPASKFSDVPGWSTDGSWFVYLFSSFGAVGVLGDRDYSQNGGGFEEWQRPPAGLTLLPESSTYAAMGVVGLAAVGVWRRSRRSKA